MIFEENKSRMMFYPGKAVFRAGYVDGTQWNNASAGPYSAAFGYNTVASGNSAMAFGNANTASGDYSTVMGYFNTAHGTLSTAMGLSNTASGDYSTAMGNSTTASGMFSTAIGSTNTASGTLTTVMGYGNTAPSYDETVIGQFNTAYAPASTTVWNAADRLFVIGNGTNNGTRSNAVTVLKNGNVGIGTALPNTAAKLHVDLGSSTANGILVTGTAVSGTVPDLGAGSRMMFYPGKAVFRAGYVDGLQWNNDSAAFGSTAIGYDNTALGNGSTALGAYNQARGFSSTALGENTIAGGDNSTAMGYYTTARSYNETAIGQFNTDYAPANTAAWNTADRLFVIGNGANSGAKSNAVTVLKNGNVGVGIDVPLNTVDVAGTLGVTSSITGSSFVKAGGASSEFLKADGSVDANTYLTTGAASGAYLPLAGGTLTGDLLFTDNTIDIGASGATRPRTGYFGTSVITPTITTSSDATINTITVGLGLGAVPTNTAVGSQALNANTVGFFNTALGVSSLKTNTAGARNTALGGQALYFNNGNDNTAAGYLALEDNTAGSYNTAFGTEALIANTTANFNTAIGPLAMHSNINGGDNTAVGHSALSSNISGGGNTAVGENSLVSNTSATYNSGLGVQSLEQNTTGASNTAIGVAAIDRNTTGSNNAVLGAFAGRYIADGSTYTTVIDNSILIGVNTKPNADNESNEIVIGYNAIGAGSNTIQLGNTGITSVNTSGKLTTGAVTFPNTDGTLGQVLTTDGAGTASWAAASSQLLPAIEATVGPLSAANSGSIFYTQNAGNPFFPENLPDGYNCVIVNYSNFLFTSNTLTTALFYTAGTGNAGAATFDIPSGGSVQIYVVTIGGQKHYYVK